MALHIRDAETDRAVRRLARLKHKSLTATIREAVEREYEREAGAMPLADRIRPIQEWLDARSKPEGLPADKAFYDDLSGEF
jgi:antitoxin VapB